MQTDLAKGIVAGKTLRQWWDETPYGAFGKKCAELGIKLEFGERTTEPQTYEVEIRYTYRGSGYTTVTVEAESENDAEKKAIEKFNDMDVDCYDAQVDHAEVRSVEKVE